MRVTMTILTLFALCLPVVAAEEPTVGSFIQRLAGAKNLDAADEKIAAETLHASGVRLPADLEFSKPLTEGDVARISRALGLAVSTNRPTAGFSNDQVDRFFSSFRVELALTANGGAQNPVRSPAAGPFNPYEKGKGGAKGKKRGRDFTPSEPE